MKHNFQYVLVLVALLVPLFAFAGGLQEPKDDRPLDLTIIHVSDTHSHFEPAQVKLTLDLDDQLKGKAVYVELGGFPQALGVIDQLRASAKNPILLHAGDMFQGTLYFTRFEGTADVALWNLAKVDVATLGNHEFDKGPKFLKTQFFDAVKFPVVDANVDISGEPDLAGVKLPPYIIKNIDGTRVGFIGLTTEETPYISSPGKKIIVSNAIAAAQKAAAQLTNLGVNKIILISHCGFDVDQTIAVNVANIDVIVDGHSHTPLGALDSVGLSSSGSYPTVVKNKEGGNVLIVSSWEWAKEIGDLHVHFDEKGIITTSSSTPKLVVGSTWLRLFDVPNKTGDLKRVQYEVDERGKINISEYDGTAYNVKILDNPNVKDDQYDLYASYRAKALLALKAQDITSLAPPNVAAANLTATYAKDVGALKTKIVANLSEDLKRGPNVGPGPLVSDAYIAKTGAQIAFVNVGGIRTDLNQGPLAVSQVYELIPFGSTLVVVNLTGAQVLSTIEDAVDFGLSKYGDRKVNPLVYSSGLTFDITSTAQRGKRISNVQVKQADGSFKPLEAENVYKVVVNNFMADGGDKYNTLKAAKGKIDTGFIDADALFDFVKDKHIKNTEKRFTLLE